jgi:multiple sugar transport system permease protein
MMNKKISKMSIFVYLLLALFLIFTLFPFVWSFITSIKPHNELFTLKLRYFPHHPTLQNYSDLFAKTDFLKNMGNSFIIAISTAILSLLVSILAAYAFSRYEFHGKYLMLISFLMINMFPTVLLMIPLYSIMRKIGLLYTPYSLIIAYSTFTIPFSIWLLTGYFNELPISLEEAAIVDGCTRPQAFIKILMPLTIPGIIATGIYIFITAWNEFVFAVMFTNQATRTLPVALQSFIGEFDIQWGLLTAGGVITTIPILLMFMFVQKKLVEGLTAGAVKG